MSTKALPKIDSFFPLFIVVAVLLGVLVIFTFKAVFTSVRIAYEPEEAIPDSELKIDKETLNTAYQKFTDKKIVKLEIR